MKLKEKICGSVFILGWIMFIIGVWRITDAAIYEYEINSYWLILAVLGIVVVFVDMLPLTTIIGEYMLTNEKA